MARIAFMVADDFEDAEFRVPYDRVRLAGHEVVVVGLDGGTQVRGKKGREVVTIDRAARNASSREFDAVVIPGGYSPDHLRMDVDVVGLVRDLFRSDKPVAAVCHGPWLLVEADIADGHTVTSWPSLKTDLVNAGAWWVDREVVEDGNLITSRNPGDLEAFTSALLRQVAEGSAPRLEAPLVPDVIFAHEVLTAVH
ncbi:type 1 glutamine amidotransferase [Myxococcus sp. K15C18031901]|uniref:type 1 glutamine amidotransferase domain-containing protein n=1 Tax=Myxococcus dinghuensis TaxID=2906761 RepID=UPI0020A7B5E7|nr:type 1 glutamine amidotransferase domain-containing protein [Myxococcus dinghuensis]MCP3099845.1 type 1 glutamine amidotransferase [Myxococcus dinghuensis]